MHGGLGFPLLSDTGASPRVAWLLNFQPCQLADAETGQAQSAVACLFVGQDGAMFKVRVPFAPYLFVHTRPGSEGDVEDFLR